MKLIFVFILLGILVFLNAARSRSRGALGGGLPGGLGSSDAVEAQTALASYGVTVRSLQPGLFTGRGDQGTIYRFVGVDRAGADVSGRVEVGPFRAQVYFDRSTSPRLADSLAKLVDEEQLDESALDIDERVAREVARRLDVLQADRAAFMASDTDGDGVVDSEEWMATRARVEAEVRDELGGGESQAPSAVEVESAPSDEQW